MRVEIQGETIVGKIEIAAPPEAVFDALTDPAQLAAWWGSDDTYRTFDWKIDPRPGGAWSCQARSAAGGDVSTVHGVYTEVDRPRALAYTWNPSWDKSPETQVRFQLEPTASGTTVRIRHAGFAGYPASRDGHAQGWTRVLAWLAAHLGAPSVAAHHSVRNRPSVPECPYPTPVPTVRTRPSAPTVRTDRPYRPSVPNVRAERPY